MQNPVETIRKILELKGINFNANYDGHDNGCTKMQDESGACKEECPHFRDCKFGSTMAIDFLEFSLNPDEFPDGFEAHLLNSIDLFHAGIDVEPKNMIH